MPVTEFPTGVPVYTATIGEILATYSPDQTRADATDAPGCTLEAKGGKWYGHMGTLTPAQWEAVKTSPNIGATTTAKVLDPSGTSTPYEFQGGAGGVVAVAETWRDPKFSIQMRTRSIPVTSLSITATESTTKDAGSTLQIAATQGSVSDSALWNPANSRFTWLHSGKYGVLGVNTDSNFITGKSVSYPTPSCNLLGMSFILYGNDVSIVVAGKGGKVSIRVDDEYINATPISLASDGNIHYIRLQMPGSGPYRIDVRGANAPMGGVWIPPTSSIMPAPKRGKKMIILGDSFTESSVETYGGLYGYCATISDLIGWDDVCPSGIGGTGYVADTSGTRKNLLDRIESDCVDLSPDVVLFAMGINDESKPYASVIANARACISRIKSLGIDVIVCAPFWNAEAQRVTENLRAIENGLKSIATEFSCKWISALEPIGTDTQPIQTTIVEAVSSGATTIKTAIKLNAGTTWKFPDGTRFNVKTTSSGAPLQTVLNSGIQTAQSNGAVITQCASSHWTGNGRTGAPAGYGTCDILVGDGAGDSTHPSTPGYKVLGYELARQLVCVFP